MQLALIVAQLTYSRSVFAKHLVVSSSQSLLLVSPAWLGDIVIAQALFRYLKIQRPQVKLDIIAPAWSHGLVKRMPEIDHILDLPFGHGQLALKKRWHVGRSLRKKVTSKLSYSLTLGNQRSFRGQHKFHVVLAGKAKCVLVY